MCIYIYHIYPMIFPYFPWIFHDFPMDLPQDMALHQVTSPVSTFL